jgi:hypothetical protein
LRHVACAGVLAGIGFTVSLFIVAFAFEDPDLLISPKIESWQARQRRPLRGPLCWRLGSDEVTEPNGGILLPSSGLSLL